MSNIIAEGQAANIIAPNDLMVLAIALDATSRVKDLGAILLGGQALEKGGSFYITLRANVRWYFRFSPNTGGTVDETAVDAAVTQPNTFPANACFEAAADEVVNLRIGRHLERYLIVKGVGAGTLRAYVSSEVTGRRG